VLRRQVVGVEFASEIGSAPVGDPVQRTTSVLDEIAETFTRLIELSHEVFGASPQ